MVNKIIKFTEKYTMMDIDTEIFFLPSLITDEVLSKIRCISKESGKILMRAINGETNIVTLVNILVDKYGISEEIASKDVFEFIETLVQMEVLEYVG